MKIIHHGGTHGVTGSCHELSIDDDNSLLIDCGLFQGDEADQGADLRIEFPVQQIKALVLTHVHIDHVGRLPYLFAAGFRGKIYCSKPSAKLLPLVLEDALKVGMTDDKRLIKKFVDLIHNHLIALDYHKPVEIPLDGTSRLSIRLGRAGHIFGSAFCQCKVKQNGVQQNIIFSGDLGAPYTPLLQAPDSPYGCDLLVLESTYGDRLHQGRRNRRKALSKLLEGCLQNGGTVLIPAFSIGRTQELLYEIESFLYRHKNQKKWQNLKVILDSPMAERVTEVYRQLRPWWDKEAHKRVRQGRTPLQFKQLIEITRHKDHMANIKDLSQSGTPSIVIAASGMCTGGRIVNYLEAMLADKRHDVLFVGYQARGTLGRTIQKYGPKGGYVLINNKRIDIKAGIHTIPGYSAHADQNNLCNFVKRMRRKPEEIILVHGDNGAKAALKDKLEEIVTSRVRIPQ